MLREIKNIQIAAENLEVTHTRMEWIIAFLLPLILLSCLDQRDARKTNGRPTTQTHAVWTEAEKGIADILNSIPETCSKRANSHPLCAEIQIAFESKKPSPKSLGKRVLVIDIGMQLAAFTRYKSRVMEYLSFSEDNLLTSTSERKTAFQGAFAVYDLLDKKFPDASLDELSNIRRPFFEKFGHAVRPEEGDIHGQMIFAKLAELTPDAEFFIIDDLEVAAQDWDKFCSTDLESSGLESFREQFKTRSREIIRLIERHKISFANFSFSESLDTWRSRASQCRQLYGYEPNDRGVEKYFEAYIEFFIKPIYSLPNFVVVQAIDNSQNFESASVRQNRRIDCTSFPNVLRVSGTKVTDAIPVDGIELRAVKVADDPRWFACADVVVNMGPTQIDELDDPGEEPIIHFSNNGIQAGVIFAPSSSHATPIALSFLLNLKTKCSNCTSEEILNQVRRKEPIVIDPIRNHQFDICEAVNEPMETPAPKPN